MNRSNAGAQTWTRLRELADRLIEDRVDRRIAPALLGAGMLVSFVFCLWAARGTTFSGDELHWVGISPDLGLKSALASHSGHLVLVSHLVYKAILETLGTNYIVFRILTLLSVYASVGLLFVYLRRRLPAFVALAPCLVLLFFAHDAGHLLQGNGFTIMLAVACGLLAIVALEADSRSGDVLACLALCLGVLTYTTALPFVAGAVVLILMSSRPKSRIWIVAIPIAIYLAWRVWLLVAGISDDAGGMYLWNLTLLPSWVFQSLSGTLNALTGFDYNFAAPGALPAGEMAGPALALALLVGIALKLRAGNPGKWFWAAVTIALALFVSQALVWQAGIREPASARYLFPDAFVLILVMAEAVRGMRWSKTTFIALLLVATAGVLTNIAIVRNSGATLRLQTTVMRTDVTAAALVHSQQPFVKGPAAVPLIKRVTHFEAALSEKGASHYGGIVWTPSQLAAESDLVRTSVDQIIADTNGLGLVPVQGTPPTAGCFQAVPGAPNTVESEVPPGGATIESATGGKVTMRRFGDAFTVAVGELNPGETGSLAVPQDSSSVPWQVTISSGAATLCPLG